MTIISLVAMVGILFIDPIAQDLNYHNFADSREIYHISNFWNVVSNLPYFFIGFYALYKLILVKKLKVINEIKIAYIVFFMGVTLVSFGSFLS